MILWTYALIPLIILIFIVVGIKKYKGILFRKDLLKINDKKGDILFENYLFENENFTEDIYENIKDALKATIILVNNEVDQKLISDFINNETGIIVNCYLEETDIKESYENLIILNYKNGKYRFNLI